jgi:hypothetical protein
MVIHVLISSSKANKKNAKIADLEKQYLLNKHSMNKLSNEDEVYAPSVDE